MNHIHRRIQRSRGFTLVEAILVIVIIGIIAGIVAVFIRAPVLGYTESAERATVSDEADLALRRIARYLRLALPNSVRLTTTAGGDSAIEFLLTSTGGRYLTVDEDVPGFAPLDFDNPANPAFTAIGENTGRIQAGNYIVVYNLGDAVMPSDAYRFPLGADMNIAQVRSVVAGTDNTATITLADNAFARQTVTMTSPNRRFQVVTTPVSYVCRRLNDGNLGLVRYWGYNIAATQAVPPLGSSRQAVIASRLDSCAGLFQYGSAATRASALVILNLALRPRGGQGLVRLVHQVHVDNTP